MVDESTWLIQPIKSRIEIKVLPLDTPMPINYNGMAYIGKTGNVHSIRVAQKYYFKFIDGYKLLESIVYGDLNTKNVFKWNAQDELAVHYISFLLEMIEKKVREAVSGDDDLVYRFKTFSKEDLKGQAATLLNSKFELEN